MQRALAVQKGLADAKWYASPIPREKMRELLERRDGPALRDTLLWFGLLLAFGLAGLALWGSGWAIIPLAIYGVLYASTSDSRWHESSHGTAFKTDWMNNALYEIASFMVMRESVAVALEPRPPPQRHHHRGTGRRDRRATADLHRRVDPEAASACPTSSNTSRTVLRHAAGRMTPAERTYIPEAEFGKVYLRARIYLLIYLAVIALAVATRSILPLLFVGLPSFYGTWLMVVYGADSSTPGWRRTCWITASTPARST